MIADFIRLQFALSALAFVKRHDNPEEVTEGKYAKFWEAQAKLIVKNELDSRAHDTTCIASSVYRRVMEKLEEVA